MTDYSDLANPDFIADYTITVGNLISEGYDTDDKLHLSSSYYPIFDESYRSALNHKIMAHYVMREIGQETPELFCFYLGRTMNEIMPYYNQLYSSAQKDFDPFLTVDMATTNDSNATTETSGKTSATATTTAKSDSSEDSTSESHGLVVHADLPQTAVDDFGRYATTADKTDSSATSHGSNSSASSNQSDSSKLTDFTHANDVGSVRSTSKGYAGMSGAQLLTAWRATMLNIDMMVINDLSELFMGVWGGASPMVPWRCDTMGIDERGYDD